MPRATCHHCHQLCRRTTGKQIYSNEKDIDDKVFYVCDNCKARVGCHPDTEVALGTAANAKLRKKRIAVHKHIDPLWKDTSWVRDEQMSKKKARRQVYKTMCERMGLNHSSECHVGMFSLEQCEQALRVMHRSWSNENA